MILLIVFSNDSLLICSLIIFDLSLSFCRVNLVVLLGIRWLRIRVVGAHCSFLIFCR